MKLTELDPAFCKFVDATYIGWRSDALMEDCDGVMFKCPKCWRVNGRPLMQAHSVICWKPGVPLDVSPGPGRWGHAGTGFADLTLTAGSSSVHLQGGCGAHFYVRDGEVIDA